MSGGLVSLATGGDGGGSIRIPAAACGVVGLKPSRGRVSWGPLASEPLSGWAVHFMVSRSVRDTAALLDLGTSFGTVRSYLDAADQPVAGERTVEVHARTSAGDIDVVRVLSGDA
mgnify:CR=1 FL=1